VIRLVTTLGIRLRRAAFLGVGQVTPIGRQHEATRRSGDVESDRESPARLCSIRYRGTRNTCTLPRNHDGPHIARGLLGRTVAVWGSGIGAQAPSMAANRMSATRRTGLGTARPAEVRTSSPAGIFEATWRRVIQTIPPFHDLVFLIFLVAFVGFAIQWALTLSG